MNKLIFYSVFLIFCVQLTFLGFTTADNWLTSSRIKFSKLFGGKTFATHENLKPDPEVPSMPVTEPHPSPYTRRTAYVRVSKDFLPQNEVVPLIEEPTNNLQPEEPSTSIVEPGFIPPPSPYKKIAHVRVSKDFFPQNDVVPLIEEPTNNLQPEEPSIPIVEPEFIPPPSPYKKTAHVRVSKDFFPQNEVVPLIEEPINNLQPEEPSIPTVEPEFIPPPSPYKKTAHVRVSKDFFPQNEVVPLIEEPINNLQPEEPSIPTVEPEFIPPPSPYKKTAHVRVSKDFFPQNEVVPLIEEPTNNLQPEEPSIPTVEPEFIPPPSPYKKIAPVRISKDFFPQNEVVPLIEEPIYNLQPEELSTPIVESGFIPPPSPYKKKAHVRVSKDFFPQNEVLPLIEEPTPILQTEEPHLDNPTNKETHEEDYSDTTKIKIPILFQLNQNTSPESTPIDETPKSEEDYSGVKIKIPISIANLQPEKSSKSIIEPELNHLPLPYIRRTAHSRVLKDFLPQNEVMPLIEEPTNNLQSEEPSTPTVEPEFIPPPSPYKKTAHVKVSKDFFPQNEVVPLIEEPTNNLQPEELSTPIDKLELTFLQSPYKKRAAHVKVAKDFYTPNEVVPLIEEPIPTLQTEEPHLDNPTNRETHEEDYSDTTKIKIPILFQLNQNTSPESTPIDETSKSEEDYSGVKIKIPKLFSHKSSDSNYPIAEGSIRAPEFLISTPINPSNLEEVEETNNLLPEQSFSETDVKIKLPSIIQNILLSEHERDSRDTSVNDLEVLPVRNTLHYPDEQKVTNTEHPDYIKLAGINRYQVLGKGDKISAETVPKSEIFPSMNEPSVSTPNENLDNTAINLVVPIALKSTLTVVPQNESPALAPMVPVHISDTLVSESKTSAKDTPILAVPISETLPATLADEIPAPAISTSEISVPETESPGKDTPTSIESKSEPSIILESESLVTPTDEIPASAEPISGSTVIKKDPLVNDGTLTKETPVVPESESLTKDIPTLIMPESETSIVLESESPVSNINEAPASVKPSSETSILLQSESPESYIKETLASVEPISETSILLQSESPETHINEAPTLAKTTSEISTVVTPQEPLTGIPAEIINDNLAQPTVENLIESTDKPLKDDLDDIVPSDILVEDSNNLDEHSSPTSSKVSWANKIKATIKTPTSKIKATMKTPSKVISSYLSSGKEGKHQCDEKYPNEVKISVCVLNKCTCMDKPNMKGILKKAKSSKYLLGKKKTQEVPEYSVTTDIEVKDADGGWIFRECRWRSQPDPDTKRTKFSPYVGGWRACKDHCEREFPEQDTVPVCMLNKCVCPQKLNVNETILKFKSQLPGSKPINPS